MGSPSTADLVEGLLAAERALVVAPAGCGKTELLARTVAHPKAGRQLILTHTHAGVAAVKRRLDKLNVAPSRYRLETIAGWSLRYALAYPAISGFQVGASALPEWSAVYPAAIRVLTSPLAKHVLGASYDGVLVDEYQDCTASQHRVVMAAAMHLPVRVVGDPLQAIFGFRSDPLADWSDVEAAFPPLTQLSIPWRWRDRNSSLGEWLLDVRTSLLDGQPLTIDREAPVEWEQHDGRFESQRCERAGRTIGHHIVAVKKRPQQCGRLTSQLRGRFHAIEAFDEKELPEMLEGWPKATGPRIVRELHEFARKRMTGVGPDLDRIVRAIAAGRPTHAFRNNLDHRDRLVRLAEEPTPEHALAALEGFRAHGAWIIHRPDGIYQLRTALQESVGLGMQHVPVALATVRTQVRHRGRFVPKRIVGTTLLVKGLEFDSALVLNADELSRNELYVAITRGSTVLRITSSSRRITPAP